MKKPALAVLVSGIWISFSEFLRNEILFKGFWLDRYAEIGMEFPSAMINNLVWGLWSFVFAGCVLMLSIRLKRIEAFAIAWVTGFALMWMTVGNLNVLPFGLLPYAVPLSALEVYVALLIDGRIAGGNTPGRKR